MAETTPVAHPRWLRDHLGEVTGRGVRVGIVDSGFDPGLCAAGPVLGPGCDLVTGLAVECPIDRMGHGIACLMTAYRVAPGATYVPIRVFDEVLDTSVGLLTAAVEWATHHRVDVLNLSMRIGQASHTGIEALYRACEAADRAGIIVLASDPDDGIAAIPAWFDHVLGIACGRFPDPLGFSYHTEDRTEIVSSSGIGGEVVWLGGEPRLHHRSSFSAPVIAGLVALLRERFPDLDLTAARRHLEALAARRLESVG